MWYTCQTECNFYWSFFVFLLVKSETKLWTCNLAKPWRYEERSNVCSYTNVTDQWMRNLWVDRITAVGNLLSTRLCLAVAQLLEALRYKSEGRGFDSRRCHWNFSLI